MSSKTLDWKKELPMIATYSRIGIGVFIVALLFSKFDWAGWASAVLFALASFTDWLDGYWARKYHCESVMGQFMDPIADKLLVLPTLTMLLWMQRIDPFIVILLSSRDIFIGGLRSVAAANHVIIAAKPFGKWKTGFQMLSIPMLLIYEPLFGVPIAQIGIYGLWISVVLSAFSGIEYSWGYWKGRKP
ncbi:MAG: CDP-diacylglycerol--glycerol-3-phosphate 3-phosphatidyltransferase [Bdellovibrionales bacterium]|nr:CDP-diacylglycerol--glycerol-3-phosphate 3-phosphatidyltransferase [Bdellovibrionales bacterium]